MVDDSISKWLSWLCILLLFIHLRFWECLQFRWRIRNFFNIIIVIIAYFVYHSDNTTKRWHVLLLNFVCSFENSMLECSPNESEPIRPKRRVTLHRNRTTSRYTSVGGLILDTVIFHWLIELFYLIMISVCTHRDGTINFKTKGQDWHSSRWSAQKYFPISHNQFYWII